MKYASPKKKRTVNLEEYLYELGLIDLRNGATPEDVLTATALRKKLFMLDATLSTQAYSQSFLMDDDHDRKTFTLNHSNAIITGVAGQGFQTGDVYSIEHHDKEIIFRVPVPKKWGMALKINYVCSNYVITIEDDGGRMECP